MSWYHVSEDLPPEGQLVLAYSEVFGEYKLSKWTATMGWLDQNNKKMTIITHWIELKISFPFEVKKSVDREAAEKYGMEIAYWGV